MNTVLVKVGMESCLPCKALEKVLVDNEFPQVDEIQFISADDNKEMVKELGIRSVPTLILYREGVEIKRKTGMMDLRQLNEWLDN